MWFWMTILGGVSLLGVIGLVIGSVLWVGINHSQALGAVVPTVETMVIPTSKSLPSVKITSEVFTQATETPMATVTMRPSFTPSSIPMSGMIRPWDVDGSTLVYIPGGDFTTGPTLDDLKDGKFLDESRYRQKVTLAGFWMDQTEVTNAMYQKCVSAGICQPPQQLSSMKHPDYYNSKKFKDYPVIFVDYDMARTFCQWAGMRLPSDAEWELAARGQDGRSYPWGSQSPDCRFANLSLKKICFGDTTEVGKLSDGNSPWGLKDMAGNVWEWVSIGSPIPIPTASTSGASTKTDTLTKTPEKNINVELRGGAWDSKADQAISFVPNMVNPEIAGNNIGFRCVLSQP
jgi:formylglycine-generating enzyme required for sulfatase activity